jgi:UrcA family protein
MAIMKRAVFFGLAVGTVASTLMGTSALAQNTEEVTVVGVRRAPVVHVVGGSPGGAKEEEVSISYGVSYKALDLTSSAGAAELKKRVNDAASAACKEIGEHHPVADFTPSEADCAKAASDKAMKKVDELIAAAGKKAAK